MSHWHMRNILLRLLRKKNSYEALGKTNLLVLLVGFSLKVVNTWLANFKINNKA